MQSWGVRFTWFDCKGLGLLANKLLSTIILRLIAVFCSLWVFSYSVNKFSELNKLLATCETCLHISPSSPLMRVIPTSSSQWAPMVYRETRWKVLVYVSEAGLKLTRFGSSQWNPTLIWFGKYLFSKTGQFRWHGKWHSKFSNIFRLSTCP